MRERDAGYSAERDNEPAPRGAEERGKFFEKSIKNASGISRHPDTYVLKDCLERSTPP